MKISANQLNLNSSVEPNRPISTVNYLEQKALYKLNSIIDTSRPRILTLDNYNILDELKIAKLFDGTSEPVGILTHYQGEKNYIVTKGIVFDGGLIGNIGDIVYCAGDGFLTTNKNNFFVGKIIAEKTVFIDIGEQEAVNFAPSSLDSKNFIAGTNVLKMFGLNGKLLRSFGVHSYPNIKTITDGNAIICFYTNRIDYVLSSNKTQQPWNMYLHSGGAIRSVSYVAGRYFIFGDNKLIKMSTTGYDSYEPVLLPPEVAGTPDLHFSSSYKNRIFFMTNTVVTPVICYSNDRGDTWSTLDHGYNIYGLITFTIITKNNIIIRAEAFNPSLWVSQNNTMVQVMSFPEDKLVGLAYNGNVLMAVTDYGAIYISYDEGVTWEYSLVNPLGQNVNAVTFLESLNLFVISTENLSFFLSQDGLKWTHIDNPGFPTPEPTKNITFIDEPKGNIIISYNNSFTGNSILHEIKKL